jgi:hypothetical protein
MERREGEKVREGILRRREQEVGERAKRIRKELKEEQQRVEKKVQEWNSEESRGK